MNPRPRTRTEEETTRDGGQEVQRRVTETPDEEIEETTTRARTPAGERTRRVSEAGETYRHAQEEAQKRSLFRAYQILWYLLGLVEILLAFRFVLKAAGANPRAGFARFLYGVSEPFAAPFNNLFGPSIGPGAETASIIEWSTIIAMIVYALIVWGIVKLLTFGRPVERHEVDQTLNEV